MTSGQICFEAYQKRRARDGVDFRPWAEQSAAHHEAWELAAAAVLDDLAELIEVNRESN